MAAAQSGACVEAYQVSPPLHYWTSELPKLLSFSLPLLAVDIGMRRMPGALAIATTHVALLSLVQHKEWRFIVYTLPLWNAASATGAALLTRRGMLLRAASLACIGMCTVASLLLLWVSSFNYPGGAALFELHRRASGSGRVHICVHAAMTGVSRFQSIHMARPRNSLVDSAQPAWEYDKTEALSSVSWENVTWAITDAPCSAPFVPLGAPIRGLTGVSVRSPRNYLNGLTLDDAQSLLPLSVRTAPLLWVCTSEKEARGSRAPRTAHPQHAQWTH